MQGLILAIAPIFAIVVLGHALRRLGLPGETFWPMAARLGYWVLIPSLLFSKLSTARIDLGLIAPFAITLGGAFYLVGAVVLLVTWLIGTPAAARGSALQGAVRHNSFMALAVAETLYGPDGLSLAALAAAMLALVTNLSIIPALLMLDPSRPTGSRVVGRVLRDLARNPLLLSILAGLGVNLVTTGPIPVLHDMTTMLGAVALPLMLLCVGAGLRLRGLKAQLAPMGIATAGKYLLFPAAVLGLGYGIDGPSLAILLIFAAVPTAPSSSALAAETGGDVALMNTIVTAQTALAFVTVPLTLALGSAILGL